MKAANQFPHGGSSDYTRAVESGLLYGLPLTLRTFYCGRRTQMEVGEEFGWPSLIPPQVTYLSLATSVLVRTPFFYQLLPPSVSHLDLTSPNEHSQDWPVFQTDPASCPLYLAHHLQKLSINYSGGNNATIFAYLPRSLLTLEWKDPNSELDLGNLQLLPLRLTDLDIVYKSTRTRQPWLGLLPKTLIQLKATLPIEGFDFINLPPRLTYLRNEHFFEVSLLHMHSIPKHLKSIFFLRARVTFSAPEPYLSGQEFMYLLEAYQPLFRILETTIDDNILELAYYSEKVRSTRVAQQAQRKLKRENERRARGAVDGSDDDTEYDDDPNDLLALDITLHALRERNDIDSRTTRRILGHK